MNQSRGRPKIHVGHVVDCFGAGGIATGVLALIRATWGQFQHSLISLVDDFRLVKQLPEAVPAHVITPGRTRLLGFSSRLAWLACRHRMDILHCNNQFAWLDAALAAKLTGRICLQTFHGVERPLGVIPRDTRIKCRLAARLVHKVTAVGKASRAMVCKLGDLPEETVSIIPNGIDLTRYRPNTSPSVRSELRRKLGVAEETELVIHVAGLRPVKDQATLLRAWRVVLDGCGSGPFPMLLIAGEGECYPQLQAVAQQLQLGDLVRFLGQCRDVETMLPACDLFVVSSISEGLSFAILEAMACGLAVVATRVGGNSELVEDGQSGLLTPSGDAGALGIALGQLLRQPERRRRMGERGRVLAEQRFDLGRAATAYGRIYRQLAHDGRTRSAHRRLARVG
jgi:glycosyltransferase involved in cell wall biosynthesis